MEHTHLSAISSEGNMTFLPFVKTETKSVLLHDYLSSFYQQLTLNPYYYHHLELLPQSLLDVTLVRMAK